MKLLKTTLALAVSTVLLMGCDDTNETNDEVTIAAFNLSFDRSSFEQLVDEMETSPEEQQTLVDQYVTDKASMSDSDKSKAEKIIQIRNVAAIIQTNRPDVLMMGEYNNSGDGNDLRALTGFQNNYLSVGQSPNSIDGGDTLKPISFPYAESFATNTGLNSNLDLDNDGVAGKMPGDAWGFGLYHGQYAFALMSKFEIDKANTRTFQNFKWKDMPSAQMPTITNCSDPQNPIPTGMACGDNWYSDAEWNDVRLSSKNHVDAPIIVPTEDGNQTIHLLLSHPTPPVFDTVTEHNKLKNRDEIQFWADYIDNADYIYDDANMRGGLAANQHFVIMGDLNADPVDGDGFQQTIAGLLNHDKVNGKATVGSLVPTSNGAAEEHSDKTYPDRVTSTFGLRVDHVIPSVTLDVEESGVYWPASSEAGHLLMNDSRIGKYGNGKDISSDHRMVWIKVDLD
ncbi:endonuclease/exonuclease/phosphatase family protein [Vibrio sp. TRT 21S02]|uniref:endonuclease/exonuclease/phosphatase family protein n=1 Tax=Vibrio sp. TRT 21S02 TaxID=3418507 RepID=UPI003CEB327B